jgi:predicted site-specific integrase-resolvase
MKPMKLLRRRDVMARLGVTHKQVTKLIEVGLLRPILKRGCRAWFRAAEIEKLA